MILRAPHAHCAAHSSGRVLERECPVDALSLRQPVGQLVVLRFAGTTAPAYVLEALRERRAAGVILFRDNVTGPAQVRALTASLRSAGGRPIVAVDQEGGDIRILPWTPPRRSAPEQATSGTVRSDSKQAARALRAAGITVTLAPVGDVPSVPGAALAPRSFSSDPDVTGASQSRTIIGDVLRGRLGFRGVVVTDSMEARASLDTGGIRAVSERAVRAGADLVLLTGRGSYTPVYRHLLRGAQRSESLRARVRESAARVLALKQRRR